MTDDVYKTHMTDIIRPTKFLRHTSSAQNTAFPRKRPQSIALQIDATNVDEMNFSSSAPRDRCFTVSRCFQGILLVALLQPILFKSVRQVLRDTLSPVVHDLKKSTPLHVLNDGDRDRDRDGNDRYDDGVDIIVLPKNETESPSLLIQQAITILRAEGNVVVTGGSVRVSTSTAVRKATRQVLPNMFPRSKAMRRDDITLLTHLSTSRLDKLKLQVEWWSGPISAAIVVTNNDEANALLDFIKANQVILRMTSSHVLVEPANPGPDSYPYNVLRNLAMREAETDYVVAVDVDFVVEGYQRLVRLVHEDKNVMEALHSHRLLVIPAFENTKAGAKANAIPQSKADVVQMVEGDLVTPFELRVWSPGHKPTNFTKYYQNDTDVLYDIEYRNNFEPYFLAYRHGLPRYWNDFRSYFYNKCSYFIEVHLMGYKFSVLRDFYVFHMGQAGKPPSPTGRPPKAEQEKNFKFHEYLSSSYGVPLNAKQEVQFITEREVLK